MIQRGNGAGFALEAFGERLVGHLDGDDPIETVEDLVRSAGGSGSKRHDRSSLLEPAVGGAQGVIEVRPEVLDGFDADTEA